MLHIRLFQWNFKFVHFFTVTFVDLCVWISVSDVTVSKCVTGPSVLYLDLKVQGSEVMSWYE